MTDKPQTTKSLDEELQELTGGEAIFILRALMLTGRLSISHVIKAMELARMVVTND